MMSSLNESQTWKRDAMSLINRIKSLENSFPQLPLKGWPDEFGSRLQSAYFSAQQGVWDATHDHRLSLVAAGIWTDSFLAELQIDPTATRPELASASVDYPMCGGIDDELETDGHEISAEGWAARNALIAEAVAAVLSPEDEAAIADIVRGYAASRLRSQTAPVPKPLE
jgi:hypothetical protein